MTDPAENPDGPGLARACDQCRLRKIRCNKESPCSNCKIASRQCSSTGLGQKPREARQRVLISSQYERKIDHFESRLGGIESLLRDLTTSINGGNHHRDLRSSSMSFSESEYASRDTSYPRDFADTVFGDDTDDDPTPEFEGGSSLTAQTVVASQFVEHAVNQSALGLTNPNMQSALLSLQQIVQMQSNQSTKEIRFPNTRPMPKGGFRELPMPPMSLVIDILREIKETPPLTFTLIAAFIAIDEFTECCRKVYFATEDYSLATFIIVNAGLCYLLQEKAMLASDARAADLLKYHFTCRQSLETALSSLPLLMPARMETIKALLLGATYAVEIAKLTLAWRLNTSAALMCQALGYHRLPINNSTITSSCSPPSASSSSTPASSNNPPPSTSTTTSATEASLNDTKAGLFWFAYMFDKGLSLRFGRSSVIQDYDITLPRYMSQINISDPWKVVLNLWILQAEVGGRVYELLYSPAALARPPQARIESARALADEIKALARESDGLARRLEEVDSKREGVDSAGGRRGGGKKGAQATPPVGFYELDLVLKSDEVWYWSSLALVYRAIPAGPGTLSSTLNMECLEAARTAIAIHIDCMRLTGANKFTQAAYLHWTLIYAPFAPFIVLFCNVIETSDHSDLARMSSFVDSLSPVSTISEAIGKLHRVCQVLSNVATLYVEAKSQHFQDNNNTDMAMAGVGNDFDMYLSQLGFIGNGTTVGQGAGDMNDISGMDVFNQHTSQLGNWFSGNRTILGLVEADWSDFEPPRGWGTS